MTISIEDTVGQLSREPSGVCVLQQNGHPVAAVVSLHVLERLERWEQMGKTADELLSPSAKRKPTRATRKARARSRAKNAQEVAEREKLRRRRKHEADRDKKRPTRLRHAVFFGPTP